MSVMKLLSAYELTYVEQINSYTMLVYDPYLETFAKVKVYFDTVKEMYSIVNYRPVYLT